MTERQLTIEGQYVTDTSREASIVNEAIDTLLENYPPDSTDAKVFWGAEFDAGLAWVDYGTGDGGLGVSPKYRETVSRRLAEAGAPRWNRAANLIGIGMGGGVGYDQCSRWMTSGVSSSRSPVQARMSPVFPLVPKEMVTSGL